MKKIFLAALIALCGASFSFAQSVAECEEKCAQDCQSVAEMVKCIEQVCGNYKINTITKTPASVGHNYKDDPKINILAR